MLLLIAIRNIFRNLRRSLAIVLTVAMGVGALFCFDGFNQGIMNQYRDNTIHAHYGHGQVNTRGYLDQVFEKPWQQWIVDYGDLQGDLLSLDGVDAVFPRVSFFALLTNGNISVSGVGNGIDGAAESEFFYGLNIVEGEPLTDQLDGIVLGQGLARALDVHPGDIVTLLGNTIRGTINGLDLIVTGVFHSGKKDFDDRVFRIQLQAAQTLLDTDRVESVTLGLRKLNDWDGVARAVEERYPTLEATPFAVLDKVYYQHSVDWLKAQFRVIQIIIITIVILGIMNTVSTGILERKQEIGNLRANGESVWDVMKLLIAEGVAVGAIGAVVGLTLAIGLNNTLLANGLLMPPAPGLTRQFEVFIELQSRMGVSAFFLGVITATIATVVAGLRVVRLPIGDLLRAV